MAETKPMSVRAYARHRGCTHQAVRKAIRTERLGASLVYVGGKPKIANVELADREWEAGRGVRVDNIVGETEPGRVPAGNFGYQGYRARREAALADLAELQLAERRGELVNAKEVGERFVEVVTAAKIRLLGVPSRVKQRLPHLCPSDVAIIKSLICTALEDLADGR